MTTKVSVLFSGLKDNGLLIKLEDPDGRQKKLGITKSPLHQTYFGGIPKPNYLDLEEEILEIVGNDEKVDDFVSLMILHLFSVFLLPPSNGRVPLIMITFLEDLDKLGEYNWAHAVHGLIVKQLKEAHKKPTHRIEEKDGKKTKVALKANCIGGCLYALVVTFLERTRVESYKVLKGGIPRYYNWDMKKRFSEAAATKLMKTVEQKIELLTKNGKAIEPLVWSRPEQMILLHGCRENLLVKYVSPIHRRPYPSRRTRRKRRRAAETEDDNVDEEEEEISGDEEDENNAANQDRNNDDEDDEDAGNDDVHHGDNWNDDREDEMDVPPESGQGGEQATGNNNEGDSDKGSQEDGGPTDEDMGTEAIPQSEEENVKRGEHIEGSVEDVGPNEKDMETEVGPQSGEESAKSGENTEKEEREAENRETRLDEARRDDLTITVAPISAYSRGKQPQWHGPSSGTRAGSSNLSIQKPIPFSVWDPKSLPSFSLGFSSESDKDEEPIDNICPVKEEDTSVDIPLVKEEVPPVTIHNVKEEESLSLDFPPDFFELAGDVCDMIQAFRNSKD